MKKFSAKMIPRIFEDAQKQRRFSISSDPSSHLDISDKVSTGDEIGASASSQKQNAIAYIGK